MDVHEITFNLHIPSNQSDFVWNWQAAWKISLLVLKPEYSEVTRSMTLLLMPWLLESLRQQQAWWCTYSSGTGSSWFRKQLEPMVTYCQMSTSFIITKLRSLELPIKTPLLHILYYINGLTHDFWTRTGGWEFDYSHGAGTSSPSHWQQVEE